MMLDIPDISEKYKQLYIENILSLIKFSCRFVDRYSAEDIVQDAFVKLYDEKYLILSKDELLKLLYTTVRNLCIDQLRHQLIVEDYETRKRAELSLKEMDEYCTAEDTFATRNLYENIQKVADLLPPKRLEIFKLYYIQGIGSKEIAEQLGISLRTVENSLYRALTFLRQHVPKEILLTCLLLEILLTKA